MKKIMMAALLALVSVSAFSEPVCANSLETPEILPEIGFKNEEVVALRSSAPLLVAPVVEDKKNKSTKQKKEKLEDVVLDAQAELVEETETVEEQSMVDKLKYNIEEALKGEVTALSSKGLWADKMKMTFDSGIVDNIVPWIDYNGCFSNIWNGENYQNTIYGINFADIGVNIHMRDKKTYARFMISPVRSIEGNTYFNSFFADNYITRKVGKNNTVLVGHTWLPLGIEGKESPLVLQYFTRTQTSRTYSSVRTLGTKVMGNYKYADYQLGVYSSGRFFKDFFPGPEVAGWVDFKPLANYGEKYGKFTVSTGFNAGNAQSHYAVATGAVQYEYKRLRAITEFGMADGSNGATGFTNNKSRGINGTLSYRITPKLQAMVRYDQFDPNTDKANDLRKEYSVGLNYFIKDYAARLMVNYVYYNIENGVYGSRIMVGTQVVL